MPKRLPRLSKFRLWSSSKRKKRIIWGAGKDAATVDFDVVYQFDPLKSGITVPVSLTASDRNVSFPAKIDTGSTDCIFERKHAENLLVDVESGEEAYFGTATGRFRAFGHELYLSVLEIKIHAKIYFIAEAGISRNVLGRAGFSSNVQLGLIDYEGKLLLSRYGAND